MSSVSTQSNSIDEQHHHHGQLVTITVNSKEEEIPDGVYKVAELKARFQIPPDRELDLLVHGEFQPLNDHRSIHIQGGEVFVSHVPEGGSS